MSGAPEAVELAARADDALFALLASSTFDESLLRDLGKRREALYLEVARGVVPPLPVASEFDAWTLSLTRDIAPLCAPGFMPMHELIASGLTLAGGARGMRSLFAATPSDKETQRVRRVGSLAARVVAAVLGADGPLGDGERRTLRAMVASLGLPPDEERALVPGEPVDPLSLELLGELEPKAARLLVRGGWLAALHDGLDAREEGALAVISSRLGVPGQESASLGAEVREEVDARQILAQALIEALRLQLDADPATAQMLCRATAELCVPEPLRSALLSRPPSQDKPALGPYPLLGRAARGAVLAACWAAAVRQNPSFTRRAELAARHDQVAGAMGGDASRARQHLESLFEEQLAVVRPRA